MGELDTLHRCTLGGLGLQLQDFRVREDPIILNNVRVGSRVAIDCVGYVLADTAAGFASALGDTITSFRVSGLDFEVFGVAGVSLYKLLAAQCANGGPFVAFDMLEGIQTSALERAFRFRVMAETIAVEATEPDTEPTRTVDQRPDGLRTITWNGSLSGADVAAEFEAILEDFRDTYAWPDWVVQHRFEANGSNDAGTFSLTARELAGSLPASEDGNTIAVDGVSQQTKTRDEQMRLVRTFEFDFLVSGLDPQKLIDQLRKNVQAIVGEATPILRESLSLTLIGEVRVRAAFETLAGGDGNPLLNWTQTLRFIEPATVYEELRYSGVLPILVEQSKGMGRLVQTGTASGAGAWIKEPPPLLAIHLQPPEISYSEIHKGERSVSWTYVLAFDNGLRGGVSLDKMKRPLAPGLIP